MEKLDGYLRIKEAAEYLGVSPNTLRNWGRDGKIRAPLCMSQERRIRSPPPRIRECCPSNQGVEAPASL